MGLKIVHVFALLLAVNTALALTCYKCDSSQNSLCNYGFTSKLAYDTQDCNEGGTWLGAVLPKQCVKMVAIGNDGTEYVARGCMPYLGEACNGIAKTLGFFSSIEGKTKDMNCYPCDADKCNSATTSTGFALLGMVLAAVAFLF